MEHYRKIILLSLGAFALLYAATLAYYLPRLHIAQMGISTGQITSAVSTSAQIIDDPDDPLSALEIDGTDDPLKGKRDLDETITAHLGLDVQSPYLAAPAKPESSASHPDAFPSTSTASAKPEPMAPPRQSLSQTNSVQQALAKLLAHPPIRFQTRSDILDADSRVYLDMLARKLSEYSTARVSIEGHTDSQNRLGNNQQLSEMRAQAVKRHLEQQGVSASRLTAQGYGDSRPIAGNDTADGRARNRRIELKLQ